MEIILSAGVDTLVALMAAGRSGGVDARRAECERQGQDRPPATPPRRPEAWSKDDGSA